MATMVDIPVKTYLDKLKEELKKNENIKEPEFSKFVKTGTNRERAPIQKDWWFIRSSSVLRQVYLKGPIGVNKLRVRFGGKKNRGDVPERFYKASGKIIRTILQQLEKAEFIEKEDKNVHKGRKMTNKGKSFMDKLASSFSNKTQKEEQDGESKNTKQKAKAVKEEQAN